MIQVYKSTVSEFVGIASKYIKTGSTTESGITYKVTSKGSGKFTITYSGTRTGESSYVSTFPTDYMKLSEVKSTIKITVTRTASSGLAFYLQAGGYKRFTAEAGTTTTSFSVEDLGSATEFRLNIDLLKGAELNETITVKIEYDTERAIGESDFSSNGDMVLQPSKAEVHAELNGDWEATIEHPIDEEGRWEYLVEDNIVKMPSFYGGDQLFRIKSTVKKDSGVECSLDPIFYDSAGDCWLKDVRPTDKYASDALALMLAPNDKYSSSSDITKKATAYYEYKNFMEALNGEEDNSFINRWGGEILFNNYKVIVNKQIGEDNGVTLLYGKNIKQDGLSEEVETRDIVTRIYPKGYNGTVMSGDGYVDSPLVNSYPTVHAATIKFDDVKMYDDASDDDIEGTTGVTVCKTQSELDAALKSRCNDQYDAGIDKPTVTIEADMVLLQNAEGYEDFTDLEEVGFGDTVHCKHTKLGITTDARVIEITYDSIKKSVRSVVLGSFQNNYFHGVTGAINKINSVVNSDGTLIADRISGFIDGAMASLRAQYNVSKKMNYVALLFENLDKTSDLYGALGIGTQGLMISKTRNDDDTGWDWTTAITANGIIADTVVTGLLADKSGSNYWNLDTGEMVVGGNATFSGNLKGAKGTFTGVVSSGAAEGTDGGVYIYDDSGNLVASFTKGGLRFYADGLERFRLITGNSGSLLKGEYGATITVPRGKYLQFPGMVYASEDFSTFKKGYNIADDINLREYTSRYRIWPWAAKVSSGTLTFEGRDLASIYAAYGNAAVIETGDDADYFIIQSSSGNVLQRWNAYANSVSIAAASLDLEDAQLVSSSDERLKTNIEVADIDALSAINNIQLYAYDWIESGNHVNIGFIAQQLEAEVCEEFVDVNEENDVYRVNELKIIPYLVKSIQELSAQVTELKTKIAELSGETVGTVTRKAARKRWTPTAYTEDEKKEFINSAKPNLTEPPTEEVEENGE